jgi:hypothetical protein
MNTKIAKCFHLMKEQHLLGKVDWMVKDAEAWDSLCEWRASLDFKAWSDRVRTNWMNKRAVVHHYGVDRHVWKV